MSRAALDIGVQSARGAAARSAACFAQIGDFLVLLADFPKALAVYEQAISKKSDLECRRGG